MNKTVLEKKLSALIIGRFINISGSVRLGESVRTFEQWNDSGYRIKKGEKGFNIKVGEKTRHYYWWSQVWNVEKWKSWKKRQYNIKKENKFNLEPNGVL